MACLGKRLEASSSPALTQGLTPIAQRLGDVHAAHTFCAVEIGKRPGHVQRAMEPAGSQMQRIGGLAQQRDAFIVWRSDVLEYRPAARPVRPAAR